MMEKLLITLYSLVNHSIYEQFVFLAYVTGAVIVDDQYTEVDSIEISQEILVQPQERSYYRIVKDATLGLSSTSEYFCLQEESGGQHFEEVIPWKPEMERKEGKYQHCIPFQLPIYF